MFNRRSVKCCNLVCVVLFGTIAAADSHDLSTGKQFRFIENAESQTNELSPFKLLFISSDLNSNSWTEWKQKLEILMANFFDRHADLMNTDFAKVCRIKFSINSEREITAVQILKETGTRSFDDACIGYVKSLQGRSELQFPKDCKEREVVVVADFRSSGRFTHRQAHSKWCHRITVKGFTEQSNKLMNFYG